MSNGRILNHMRSVLAGGAAIALLAATLVMCAGCSDGVTTIDASKESIAHGEKLLAAKGEIDYTALPTAEEMAERIESYGLTNTFPNTDLKNAVDSGTLSGFEVYTIGDDDYDRIILYIHGGAWAYPTDPLHTLFCDDLSDLLNAKVYMPLYPLTPAHDYSDVYPLIEELYDILLEQNKPIIVMGDSAGGNISLGLMHQLKVKGGQMPDKLVLLAACADMTFSNTEMRVIEPYDPLLTVNECLACAKLFAGDLPLDDPLLSAVYADVSGYPDTFFVLGTNDILYPDNQILYENMHKAGVKAKAIVGVGLWHVFCESNIAERQTCLEAIAKFCK